MAAFEDAIKAFLHDEVKIPANCLPAVGIGQPGLEHVQFNLDLERVLDLLQAFDLLKKPPEKWSRIRIAAIRTLKNSS